ncbi:MAG: TetR/AcrR family transcriptional regulator [Bdellovibrionales bacterium]|nr:TetR/AcrR family transcriptional regulator [Oligoflexia bacterium]
MESSPPSRDPAFTRRQLKIAARKEFNAAGYFATDTNKIARSAGYSAGTFYRHFKDKLELFIEVYRDWHWDQMQEIERALLLGGTVDEMSIRMADIILQFYSHWKTFRASARVLALSEPRASQFKSSRRAELVESINATRSRLNFPMLPIKDLVTFLIFIERLADAIIDGEYAQFGLGEEVAKEELKHLIRNFLAPPLG